MKIAFDLHGVLDTYPKTFKSIIRLLERTGVEVCVVSGPPHGKVRESLEKIGFEDFGLHIYSVVDYLYNDGVDFDDTDPENLWCDEQIWWDSKARICQKYDIDYLVDDSMKYAPAFKLIEARFIHVSKIVGKCKE